MTAQISDKISYRNCEYRVVGWDGPALFDPAAHGLQPMMFSTGCWQGYYCAFEVAPVGDAEPAEVLRLATVFIGLTGEQRDAAERGAGPLLFGVRPRYSESDGCFVYRDIGAALPYTGRLTLGADFIWDHYVHMGFHPPWKYRTVLELTFAAGRLVQAVDRSAEMAQMRAAVADGGSPFSLFTPQEPHP
jgi:hypothetical protein